MRIYFLLRLVLISLLCVFAIASHAQEGEETFDYTKTVWIVDVIDGKGIIYARPNFDDYNARQGFIYIYELLLKYIDKLPENQSINSAVSSTPTHHLIYINGVSQQRITIGEYWLSDERKVTLMDEDDYRNLKAWLESRRKIENYKKNSSPDEILRVFRKNISPDVESFTEYFKLNLASSSAANSPVSSSKSAEPLVMPRDSSDMAIKNSSSVN